MMEYHIMSNSKEQSKICKGCITFDGYQCMNGTDENEGDCPCASCLIKVLCTDACNLYRKFDGTEQYEGGSYE